MREFTASVFITPFGYDAIPFQVASLIRRGYDAILGRAKKLGRRKILIGVGVAAIVVVVVGPGLGSVDLFGVLTDACNTPCLYILITFMYAILVSVILPIPIEKALF